MIDQITKQAKLENGYISAQRKVIHGQYRNHWHEFFEIEYMIDGKGSYSIDGKEYEITPGTLFFMSPVNFHTVHAEHVQVYNIMFSESICDPLFLATLLSCECNVFHFEGRDVAIIEALMSELAAMHRDKQHATHLLSCIVAKLGHCVTDKTQSLSPMLQAKLYILKNFRSSPTLDEVAAYVGFAPSYFCEMFKQKTGENYKHFLDSVRFDYAKKLLLFSDMTVLEVSGESGFPCYANFVRRFTKRFGISPSAFRKGGGE